MEKNITLQGLLNEFDENLPSELEPIYLPEARAFVINAYEAGVKAERERMLAALPELESYGDKFAPCRYCGEKYNYAC